MKVRTFALAVIASATFTAGEASAAAASGEAVSFIDVRDALLERESAVERRDSTGPVIEDLDPSTAKAICREGVQRDPQFDVTDLDVAFTGLAYDCVDRLWVHGIFTYDLWRENDFYGAGAFYNTDQSAATGCNGADYSWVIVDNGLGAVYRLPNCSESSWVRTGDIAAIHPDLDSFGVGIEPYMLGGHTGNIRVEATFFESWYDGPDRVAPFSVTGAAPTSPPTPAPPTTAPPANPVTPSSPTAPSNGIPQAPTAAQQSCANFQSWEDAQAHHALFPQAGLDGDGNGIACEALAAAGEFHNGRCTIPRAPLVTNNSVARLYAAYFKRLPDQAGLNYWVPLYRSGQLCLAEISQQFTQTPEFFANYGAVDNAAFVRLVYLNVLGREPDPAGYDFWAQAITFGGMTRGAMMIGFSESPEFRALTRLP